MLTLGRGGIFIYKKYGTRYQEYNFLEIVSYKDQKRACIKNKLDGVKMTCAGQGIRRLEN